MQSSGILKLIGNHTKQLKAFGNPFSDLLSPGSLMGYDDVRKAEFKIVLVCTVAVIVVIKI